jgi:integrase
MPTADYEQKVESILEGLEESDEVHPDNKQLIKSYKRDKVLDGMSYATLQRNLSYIFQVAKHVGDAHFEKMDKDDVKDVVEWAHTRDIADSTVDTYKKVLRSFWKWMNDGETTDAVAWISVGTGGNDKLPQDLLTKEEVEAQIDACKNPRDKAFVALLWETGARIGELIDLTVSDIEDREHGKKVTLDGKTGSRRLPLVESVPYLNKWLNEHPNPEPEAPLWCKIQQAGDEGLSYRYIRDKILRRTLKEADVDKPSNPHHYRHSRASYLANELTESALNAWFGWAQGSDVPARYVHLSGRDIDGKYDALHGIVDEEDEEDDEAVVECPRCDELNEPDAAFCYRCGFALDMDAAEEVEQVEEEVTASAEPEDLEKAQELVRELADNPEVLEELLNE